MTSYGESGMRGLMAGLVRREMDLQRAMREEQPAQVYPGLGLLLLLCSVPFLGLAVAWGDVQWLAHSDNLSLWQAGLPLLSQCTEVVVTFFLCLRAAIYPAAALGRELEGRTLVLFRTLPFGVARLLWTKYLFALWPLWLEAFLAAVAFIMSRLLLGSSLGQAVLSSGCWLVQTAAAIALYGSLGLWLGSLMESGERSAFSARLAAILTLFGGLLLNWVLTPPLLVAAALMYLCLLSPASYRPSQVSQGGVFTLLCVLLVPLMLWGARELLPGYCISDFTPLYAIHNPHLAVLTTALYLGLTGVLGTMAYRNSINHA